MLTLVGAACGDSEKTQQKSNESSTTTAFEPSSSAATTTLPPGDRFCNLDAAPVETGTVADPAIVELSGLVASRRLDGIYWAHNDSGDQARIFALDETGARRGEFVLDGVTALDWEDITLVPGSTSDDIVVADIGDNQAVRDSVTIVRVPEPDLPAEPSRPVRLVGLAPQRITYPDGPHDAEAIVTDPATGELVIVTKAWVGVSKAFTTIDGAGDPLRDLGEIALEGGQLVTAADADAVSVVVRTYGDVWVFARDGDEAIVDTLRREPCRAPVAREQQGEAIALVPDFGGYLTISEGVAAPIWKVTP